MYRITYKDFSHIHGKAKPAQPRGMTLHGTEYPTIENARGAFVHLLPPGSTYMMWSKDGKEYWATNPHGGCEIEKLVL